MTMINIQVNLNDGTHFFHQATCASFMTDADNFQLEMFYANNDGITLDQVESFQYRVQNSLGSRALAFYYRCLKNSKRVSHFYDWDADGVTLTIKPFEPKAFTIFRVALLRALKDNAKQISDFYWEMKEYLNLNDQFPYNPRGLDFIAAFHMMYGVKDRHLVFQPYTLMRGFAVNWGISDRIMQAIVHPQNMSYTPSESILSLWGSEDMEFPNVIPTMDQVFRILYDY